jgi:lipopolysaccharide/colanic/teichoic acid biosynthesis glycosyltransferase
MLFIALVIRFDSPGPIFFRQVRVGRFGHEFRIHKFRTMHHDARAAGPLFTVSGDPRITRVGHWLRRTKLDELPQLLDVLAGDMSLVGPRPEVPHYVAMYPDGLRDRILSVRPGITDEASLAFRHESDLLAATTDPEADYVGLVLPAKLAIYRRYVDQHSMAGDIGILLRTLALMFKRH